MAAPRRRDLDGTLSVKYVATVGDASREVDISRVDGRYRIRVGDADWEVDARATGAGIYSLLIGGVSYVAAVALLRGRS